MTKLPRGIPVLKPDGDNRWANYPPLPIISFNELEIDRVRYETWKALCLEDRKPEARKRRKKRA